MITSVNDNNHNKQDCYCYHCYSFFLFCFVAVFSGKNNSISISVEVKILPEFIGWLICLSSGLGEKLNTDFDEILVMGGHGQNQLILF